MMTGMNWRINFERINIDPVFRVTQVDRRPILLGPDTAYVIETYIVIDDSTCK